MYIIYILKTLCTGALHYVPYSFSLFSNTFCFSWILDFSTCIIFHIRTSADMKYYVRRVCTVKLADFLIQANKVPLAFWPQFREF